MPHGRPASCSPIIPKKTSVTDRQEKPPHFLIGEAESGRVAQVQPGGYRPDELAVGHVAHVAFEVADLEEARQHLQAYDVTIVGGPRPRGDGVMQLYVCDPDGYIVELFVWQKDPR
jgi:catechol 2,3-dioxygenase-like lactoylglutathione lyase family enzyme